MRPSRMARDALTGEDRGHGRVIDERAVERVLDIRQTLGESPVWCTREQVLYWVDLRGPSLHRWDPITGRHAQWPMPELIGGVVLAVDGALLVALQSGVFRFDPMTGTTQPLVAPEPAQRGNRHNDTKV